MLSRPRVACIVLARGGIAELLRRYAPVGDRTLGIDEDPEYDGWRAHLSLCEALDREGRTVALTSPAAA